MTGSQIYPMISPVLAFQAEGNEGGIVPKLAPSENFWLPQAGSELAHSIDGLFSYIMWVSAISTAAVFFAMIYLSLKYRAPSRSANQAALSQEDHSNLLEIIWSVTPFFFLISIFVWGFKDFIALRTAPKDSIEIYATGQKWKWTFKYPTGHVDSELHVPKGQNVRIVIKSTDVLHSLFIPEYRVKMDAVPGRYTDLWFKADYAGTFPVFCTEYCGQQHSDMLSQAVVHEGKGYEEWLTQKALELESKPPVVLGELTYKQFGCGACHSLNGTPNTGPSFKGLFGKTETLVSGRQVTVDENYIRDSILEPMKDVVQGFPPQMPSFKGQISDKRIDGLIAYIKSIQ
jgi:cytochrome c oxidase subunit II